MSNQGGEDLDTPDPVPAGPAFRAEWIKLRAKILRMAIAICRGNTDRGSDLFQETFYKVDSGRRPWIEGTDLIHRCRGIMRNLVRKERKSFQNKSFEPYATRDFEYDGEAHVETLHASDPSAGPDERILQKDILIKMWDAVDAALDGLAKDIWALTRQGIVDRQPQAAQLGVDITRVDKARQRIREVCARVVEQHGLRQEHRPRRGANP